MRDQYLARGYALVYTPHIARSDLWKTSGHYGFYAENMFKRMAIRYVIVSAVSGAADPAAATRALLAALDAT